jgi:hypothetical protein
MQGLCHGRQAFVAAGLLVVFAFVESLSRRQERGSYEMAYLACILPMHARGRSAPEAVHPV